MIIGNLTKVKLLLALAPLLSDSLLGPCRDLAENSKKPCHSSHSSHSNHSATLPYKELSNVLMQAT